MRRDIVLERLNSRLDEIRRRFQVARLSVFGSVARNEASEDSDVDVLVAFDGPATYDRYFGLKFLLEDVLEARVDLVTEKALRSGLREAVLNEAILVS